MTVELFEHCSFDRQILWNRLDHEATPIHSFLKLVDGLYPKQCLFFLGRRHNAASECLVERQLDARHSLIECLCALVVQPNFEK